LVEADHPGWIQILQTKQKPLLEAVRRGFPELAINGISFRLSRNPGETNPEEAAGTIQDPTGPSQSTEEETIPAASTSGDEKHGAEQTNTQATEADPYANITDENFKSILKRLEQSIQSKYRDIKN
jgi:hypothetical protein